MEHGIPHLRDILIFLTVAGILVPLFQKIRISPVLGFLLCGAVLGPFGTGLLANHFPILESITIEDTPAIHILAEFGILFLLFTIGLELSFERLSALRTKVFGLGSLQVSLSALAIGLVAHYGFGQSPVASMLVGLGLSLSSTAIVMQLLGESRRLGTRIGSVSFAILLFQDLSVILILFFFGFATLNTEGGLNAPLMWYLAKSIGFAVVSVIGITLIGRLILRPMFRLVGHDKNPELFMAATLLVLIAIAVEAEIAGLSMALGAFLAGLLLAETEHRHEILSSIEPFKGLLLGLFFVSIGMGIDIRIVASHPWETAIGVIALFAIKTAVLYSVGRYIFKYGRGGSLELGMLLGGAGEFAFIVIALGTKQSILPEPTAQFMLIVASLSMVATPFVARLAYRLRVKIDGPDESIYGPDSDRANDLEGHIILAGFGKMGRIVADALTAQNMPVIAIERNPARAFTSTTPVLHGDATNPKTLEKAGIHRASAVAVLVDSAAPAIEIIKQVRAVDPGIMIIARAIDGARTNEMMQLGVSAIIPDTLENSLFVARTLMEHMGVPDDVARRIIDEQRKTEQSAITA